MPRAEVSSAVQFYSVTASRLAGSSWLTTGATSVLLHAVKLKAAKTKEKANARRCTLFMRDLRVRGKMIQQRYFTIPWHDCKIRKQMILSLKKLT
jgi:hypothetical protein